MSSGSIILEYAQIKNALEVHAIDADDGLEISFIAPVSTPQEEIDLIARRKLDWVRRRNADRATSSDEKTTAIGRHSDDIRRDGRRGIIV